MPYGVTSQMIEAWGPVIFDLSLNKQVRRGDPVRKLDHAAWVAQRAATGLCDDEIAERIGLARPQVTFIRNVLERRVFRTNQYRKLYRLGGGLRWRPDEYVDPEEAYAIRPEAALLRQALAFDRDRVAAWIGGGQWTAETAWHRITRAAHDRADAPAVHAGNESLTWVALRDAAEAMAAGLAGHGVGRGEAVALALPLGIDAVVAIAAVWRLGGVVLPLPAALEEADAADLLHRGRVRAVLFDPSAVAMGADGLRRLADMLPALTLLATPEGGEAPVVSLCQLSAAPGTAGLMPPVGGDPALLLASGARLAPHTHQTLLAGARALAGALGDAGAAVGWTGACEGPGFAVALGQWLVSGSALALGDPAGDGLMLAAAPDLASGATIVEADGGEGTARVVTTAECPALLIGTGGGADAWRAAPGVDLRAGNDGALEAQSPGAAPGYVDDPAATAAAFRPGGWVRTGLRATVDTTTGDVSIEAAPAA